MPQMSLWHLGTFSIMYTEGRLEYFKGGLGESVENRWWEMHAWIRKCRTGKKANSKGFCIIMRPMGDGDLPHIDASLTSRTPHVLQVYKGEALLIDPNDSTDPPLPKSVAIKVIHPNVKKQIESDLELMRLGGE